MSDPTDPRRRHDFVLLFDVTDGNPNGDPDAGNLPRTDPETRQGLVTDVALKRKVRNFVSTSSLSEQDELRSARNKIFVEHHGVLNEKIRRAYLELGMATGTPVVETVPDALLEPLQTVREILPEAFTFDEVASTITYSGELSADELRVVFDGTDEDFDSSLRSFLESVAKKSGKPDKSRTNAERAKAWMCKNFFDIRMFGAVMSTGLNAGQVRGPTQLTFARSVDPVLPQDLSITRVAVTDARDREKLRTIGRKAMVPYGLYVTRGFFNPNLAADTGADRADLELFWQALLNMWELDRSASRGFMAPRGLYVFTHDSVLGNAPTHTLFERITIKKHSDVATPRAFRDYDVVIDEGVPKGIKLTKMLG